MVVLTIANSFNYGLSDRYKLAKPSYGLGVEIAEIDDFAFGKD